MVKDAEREKEDLASKMARYEALQKELCDLYLHVFDGPSEEFPEADRLKYQVHTVQSLHRQIQDTLETECRVSELLAKAEQAINACRETIQGPLKNIPGCDPYDRNLDILNTGPTMPEQDVLWRAQLSATTANDLTQEAKSLSPFVQLGDSLFAAITNLRKEREAAQRRANNAGTQLIEVDQTLEEAKLALTSHRAELLQGICREMEHSSTSDHPPSYHAISAPTEAFTAEAPPVPIPITPAQTQSPRPTAASVPVAGWGSSK
ncbi:hypothetical protein H0H93_003269 [Arthromyces matolae]|nr:hypothetical protein H0H93_003269 [Arthromyces matolae]